MFNKVKWILSFFFCLFLLFGCTTPKPSRDQTAIEQMQQQLHDAAIKNQRLTQRTVYVPKEVRNALIPSLAPNDDYVIEHEKHFDISTNKMPARAFFMGLVEGTP